MVSCISQTLSEGKGVMRTYFVDRFAAGDAESKALRSALARKALRSALARVGFAQGLGLGFRV